MPAIYTQDKVLSHRHGAERRRVNPRVLFRLGVDNFPTDHSHKYLPDRPHPAGIVVNLTLEPSLQRLRENSMDMNQYLSYYEIHANGFFETAGMCEANIKAVRRRLGYFKG
jgi:hypothetical protein